MLAALKTTACPHCKRVGNLIRHGFLRGYDQTHQHQPTIRARRVYCSNRRRASGCGRTFSVWLANRIRRLFLTADALWAFLQQAVASGNKLQAFRDLQSGLSDSAPTGSGSGSCKHRAPSARRLCDGGRLPGSLPLDRRNSRSRISRPLAEIIPRPSPPSKPGCKPASCSAQAFTSPRRRLFAPFANRSPRCARTQRLARDFRVAVEQRPGRNASALTRAWPSASGEQRNTTMDLGNRARLDFTLR